MSLGGFWYKILTSKGRMKPQLFIIGGLIFIGLFGFFLLSAHREAALRSQQNTPFSVQKTSQPRKLDYKIIEMDTIPFSHITSSQKPTSMTQSQPAQEPVVERQPVQQRQPAPRQQRSTSSAPPPSDPVSQQRTPPSTPYFGGSPGSSGGSDMIIVNNMEPQQQSYTSYQGGIRGLQSVRLKVILPQRTPVSNGSLIEARVINEGRLADLTIPRRAKLIGNARLFNNRVQIDFREVEIQGRVYTCSGTAYDLKLLPGIPYNGVGSAAQEAIVDELKSATSGIPIVGRMVNRPDFNRLTDETTTLEEGLEFYAVITNIF